MGLFDLARLSAATARSLAGPSLGSHETSRIRLRVVPEDLDLFGHVTNARYLSLLNLGRGDWVLRTGLMRAALSRRAPLLAGRIDVTYLAPLRLWQPFEIATRALHWSDKWFYFEHRLESNGKPVAAAIARALFRGPKGNIPPAEMLAAAGRDPESPPMPESLRAWSAALVER